jgi:hypothetical protein
MASVVGIRALAWAGYPPPGARPCTEDRSQDDRGRAGLKFVRIQMVVTNSPLTDGDMSG